MLTAAQRYVGSPVKRVEDLAILTGSGRYVDDVSVPGLLHAAFVRSPLAHGRIRTIDVEVARRAPGVIAVYTGLDIEQMIVPGPIGMAAMLGGVVAPFTLLCTDKVRMVGDPIALVVAETRYLAEDACEAVVVDYEDLPPVTSATEAIRPDAAVVFEELGGNVLLEREAIQYGDVAAAFERADRVIGAHLSQHRHQNAPMEGRGILASFDAGSGRLVVHAATQSVHLTRSTLAARLGLSEERVRVLAGDIGGSFGLKIGTSREEVAVVAAARALGRPVKWIEDRNENLVVSGQAREESFDVEAAVTEDGRVLGLRVRMLLDSGAYSDMGWRIDQTMQAVMPGPYRMEALSFQSTIAITNKAPYIAYRGPWAAETFVRERMMDLIARELGLDPIDIRLGNVVTPGEAPFEMVTGRSLAGVTAHRSLERIGEMVDFVAFRRRQQALRSEGRLLGIGVATYLEPAPGPRGSGGPLGAERARARLEADGTIVLFTGQTPHGQGHRTTLAQIVADEMGMAFDRVRVEVGDTGTVPPGFTGGSRAATMAGGAALVVTRQLRAQLLDLASEVLEASVDDLEIAGGAVQVRGVPASAIDLAQIARRAEGAPSSDGGDRLVAEATYEGGEAGWSGGTHCAEVEVDPDTGRVSIRRYLVVEDCGDIINPAIVAGQIRGGVAQGVGAVLLEHSYYDESGQFLAGTLMDYLLPGATDIPHIEIEHVESVALDADVNFRGVGEGGMIVAPVTLCNAIEDALAEGGVRIYEQHLPPGRIVEILGSPPVEGNGTA